MRARRMVALASLALLAGCYDARTIRRHDDSGPAALDSGPPPPAAELLDLLFLVDNSNSMIVEQASLADALPSLMRSLATGDHDGDGRAEARPFTSIQVGVITPDMGSGGAVVPTCKRDPDLYDTSSATYSGLDLNLRCWAVQDIALHPIERYVSGLLQLRRHPSRLAFFPIAGVPVDLEPEPGAAIDWDRLVGPSGVRDIRMEWRIDPDMPNRLTVSCNTSRGTASPPVRILRVAQELEAHGARVALGSLCHDSYPLASFLAALRR